MGLFRIVRGVVKTVEGIIEGDGEKILKGVAKTATGVVTTIVGTDDNDDELDDD